MPSASAKVVQQAVDFCHHAGIWVGLGAKANSYTHPAFASRQMVSPWQGLPKLLDKVTDLLEQDQLKFVEAPLISDVSSTPYSRPEQLCSYAAFS